MGAEQLVAIENAFSETDSRALLNLFTGIGRALSLRGDEERAEIGKQMEILRGQIHLVDQRLHAGLDAHGNPPKMRRAG